MKGIIDPESSNLEFKTKGKAKNFALADFKTEGKE